MPDIATSFSNLQNVNSATMVESFERQSSYSDCEALIEDFQSLLSDVNLSDTCIVVFNQQRLALHSQILRARSAYFNALLSPQWAPIAPNVLHKPNVEPEVFQDLIEFLMTGTISLSVSSETIRHNIMLVCLAHEVGCEELEELIVQHMKSHMTLENMRQYMSAVYALPEVSEEHGLQTPRALPPPSVDKLFMDCLAQNIAQLNASLAGGQWKLMRTIWAMLANAHATGCLQQLDVTNAVRAIMEFSEISKGRALGIGYFLHRESVDEREALLSFLLAAPALMFKQFVEPRGFFTDKQLVEKYRRDAIQNSHGGVRKMRPKYRIVCESEHPYKSGARLDLTARKVELPCEEGSLLRDTLILFDERSCLGNGAELNFYTKDPSSGVGPYALCVGGDLHPIVLPGSEFWYAFRSGKEEEYERFGGKVKNEWGWRFFAEPIAPEIDCLD